MALTVLITGCSSGFGYHTALLLARSGYRVLAGIRQPKDFHIFDHLESSHRPLTFLLDVTWSQARLSRLINKLVDEHGNIDVLVNNAGFGFLGAVSTFTSTQFQSQLDTNLLGPFKVTKAVLPHMRAHKTGLIINVSSLAGLITFAGYGIYSASKFALEALTQSLRAEESIFGIDVVSLNPGSFSTRFWKNEKFSLTAPTQDSPFSLVRFNRRIQSLVNRSQGYRGHPDKVAQQIKRIIESKHRRLNYLVGLDAHLIYLLSRLLPRSWLLYLTQRLVKRLA